MNISEVIEAQKTFSCKGPACKKCPNVDYPFSPSTIHMDSGVVIVVESQLGIEAYQLLHKTMEEVGMDLDRVSILSCVKCRQSGAEVLGTKTKRLCTTNYLIPELARIKPSLIVLIGSVALETFFDDKTLLESKGNLLQKDGQHYLPVVHPAYCIRNPHNTSFLRRDLAKIRKFLTGDLYKDRDFKLVDSEAMADEAREILLKAHMLGIDIETNMTLDPFKKDAEIWTIAFAYEKDKAYCFPLGHPEQLNVPLRYKCIQVVKDVLVSKVPKCLHNATFDIKWLRKFGYTVDTTKLYDSMVMAHLLDEHRVSKGLKALSAEYLDGCQEQFSNDLKSLAAYNCEDSSNCLRLTEIFLAEIKAKPSLFALMDTIMMPVIDSLVDLELNGFYLDQDYLKTATALFSKKREAVLETIAHKFPDAKDVNINSPRQLSKYFFETKGLTPIKQTATGNSVDVDVLKKLKSKGSGFARYLLKYRECEKILSTYLLKMPTIVHEDSRIRAHFNLTGTVTGRLSSSNPNMQNLPRDPVVKRMFAVPPGHVFLQLDASQAELRVGCSIANEPTMIDAYRKGMDIHKLTAARVLGIPMAEVTKEDRQKAKGTNFGLLYGQKTEGFLIYAESKYGIKMSYSEGDKIRKEFFKTYSRLPAWYQEVDRRVKMYGKIEYPTGYTAHFPQAKGARQMQDQALNQAINYPVQGSSSHIIFYTMVCLRRFLMKAGAEFKYVSQVHDSIGLEIKHELIADIKTYMDVICHDLIPHRFPWLKVPMVFDMAVGASWGDMIEIKEAPVIVNS